jgi:hypothetical protein
VEEFTRLTGLSGDNVFDSLYKVHEDGYTVKEIDVAKAGGKK